MHAFEHFGPPRLRRIAADHVFPDLPDPEARLLVKWDAVRRQTYSCRQDATPAVLDAAAKYIIDHCGFPLDPYEGGGLEQIALQLPYDIAVHRLDGRREWLAYTHACFPARKPEDQIGKSLVEVLGPLSGVTKQHGRALTLAMLKGSFERTDWGLVFDDAVNRHPRTAFPPFRPEAPVVNVHTERTATAPLPRVDAVLLVTSREITRQADLDQTALAHALSRMTTEQQKEKGVFDCYHDLLFCLNRS